MATPEVVPLFKTYWEYFASTETNLFTENFAAIMAPYALDPANSAAAHEPTTLFRQVYYSTMLGDPTVFLLFHPTLGFDPGNDPSRLSLVHLISRYDSRIGRLASPWDDKAFGTRGDIVMGTVSCVRWLPAYMRQTSMVVALTADTVYSDLSGNLYAPLFGPYVMIDAGLDQVKTRYAV